MALLRTLTRAGGCHEVTGEARGQAKGKLVLESSTLGHFSMVGYSTYSPGTFALRGLAEALYLEFMLYGIGVHNVFPDTSYSPGYDTEARTKPTTT
ncbi:uncharacterized protein TRAVEDRAFT_44838 [Trametes versicolor FP-101664 SS1]|uniref:uncharacterized protein n=1 Tax=Trametes versicolor (strain FP-101664) TaxID=717944 RepID=UPI000462474C|nr:uncharacterized protein TRAVEDRAFT_44838 [Trametes versicolor FP-101664 SS1]EIW62006.1 hypothetical protein TRAVEDRAFT_44838 [Trametes versicolor FP-101664 SS1]